MVFRLFTTNNERFCWHKCYWDGIFWNLEMDIDKKIIIFEGTRHNNNGCHGDLRVRSFDNEMWDTNFFVVFWILTVACSLTSQSTVSMEVVCSSKTLVPTYQVTVPFRQKTMKGNCTALKTSSVLQYQFFLIRWKFSIPFLLLEL